MEFDEGSIFYSNQERGDGARRQVREDVGLPQRLQMLETQMQMSLCPNAAGKWFF